MRLQTEMRARARSKLEIGRLANYMLQSRWCSDGDSYTYRGGRLVDSGGEYCKVLLLSLFMQSGASACVQVETYCAKVGNSRKQVSHKRILHRCVRSNKLHAGEWSSRNEAEVIYAKDQGQETMMLPDNGRTLKLCQRRPKLSSLQNIFQMLAEAFKQSHDMCGWGWSEWSLKFRNLSSLV